jgi:hypothetical protein
MNTKRFTISITAGIDVVLLLIGGTGATTIPFNTGYAQTATGSQNQTTEEVFIVQNTSMSVPATVSHHGQPLHEVVWALPLRDDGLLRQR